MVNFLLWKQSLDPTRFARYHPKLAPVLHKIALAPVVADVDPAGDGPDHHEHGRVGLLDADVSGRPPSRRT